MNSRKLNVKPKTIPPKTIQRPLQEVKYPARNINSITWESFSQEDNY